VNLRVSQSTVCNGRACFKGWGLKPRVARQSCHRQTQHATDSSHSCRSHVCPDPVWKPARPEADVTSACLGRRGERRQTQANALKTRKPWPGKRREPLHRMRVRRRPSTKHRKRATHPRKTFCRPELGWHYLSNATLSNTASFVLRDACCVKGNQSLPHDAKSSEECVS